MFKRSLSALSIGLGGLAMSISAGTGIAIAAPDLGPAVNSTCTYPQFVAALNTENPEAAAGFNASPPDQSAIQRFLAAPPGSGDRLAMAQMVANNPGAAQAIPVLQQVFSVCNNY
ncbi:hemophore-related protein [Mycolicibacterium celeriflavum]|uniref:hemophore-related protein n=1 Tax=Mycolicibacterium celeriflavum TaxID=1249101 RepID=UPI003CEB3637